MRIFFLLFYFFNFLHAQTYEEFLRSQNEAFNSYKEERDKQFSQYLDKEWKAYKESIGVKAYKKKKPLSLPKAKTLISKKPIVKIPVIKQIPLKEVEKRYTQIIIKPESEQLKTLFFSFFGVELTLHYDKSIRDLMQRSVSKEKISQSWTQLAKSDYKPTINELKAISKKLRLNDWAKYLLVKKTANTIYKNKNEARIFTWFTLLKMDYDVHLSFQKNRIVLLLPIAGELYNTVYYTLNSKQYYAIDYYAKGKIGPIMTYENEYEGENSEINFAVTTLPLLAQYKVKKNLSFDLGNVHTSIALEYDKNLFNFYQTYPQVDYTNYFSAPESVLLDASIKNAFEPLILGKSQSEALDIILGFVQNAFKYKVDTEQFKEEKVMFPSETIFYSYSDCEDRAILFSYMVKVLLGMDVVGLKYPNHMATAVQIKEKVQGEYISYKNKSYIVADPTYVNAKIGLSMPQYRGKKSYTIVATGSEK